MATGKSYVPITPGRVVAGQPEVVYVPEASEQTFDRGAPLVRTAGLATEMAANGILLYGFAAEDGVSASSAGIVNTAIYPVRFGRTFVGSLKATMTTAMIGSVANLVEASSTWYLDTSTSVSSVAQCVIEGPAEGFVVGDTNPLVYFTILQADVEEGV